MYTFLNTKNYEDIMIIDSQFPQKTPLGFRNVEINEYFRKIENLNSYAMYPMNPGSEAWFTHDYGVKKSEFDENRRGYLLSYPTYKKRIKYLDKEKKYKAKLAYSFFLAETYVLLPFFEKNKIPFVFVLYPGGSFGLNNKSSDAMLKKIFNSKYFRGVIVTQNITKDYIIDKRLCLPRKVHYIYGGFVQFKKEDVLLKKYYRKDKKTFDICFVAAKYSEGGIDKGYDTFIKIAKVLSRKTADINFHVVGGFNEKDQDIKGMEDRIKFYGYQQSDFLKQFYSKMDIFLAPNKPYKLYEGNFDGFPLGIDAAYCGVALFVADELHMNDNYIDDKNIVIISQDVSKAVNKIMDYYENIDTFYSLLHRCQNKSQELFDIDHQANQRIDVFSKYTKIILTKPEEVKK